MVEIMARGLTIFGLSEDDILQNTHGYGLFEAGSSALRCPEDRATVIPISTGQSKRQIEILQDFGTNVLIFTPSYGLYLSEIAQEEGVDMDNLKLKSIGFGSEMWTNGMRKEIEKRFGVPAFNIYGLTEIMGPGIALECEEQDGLHIMDDHFYPRS